MKWTRTAVLRLTLAGILSASALAGLAATAQAGVSKKQAMASCRAKFGNDITDVVIKKNGQIVGQQGPGEKASRKEVYEYCKRTFSATTIIMQKKGGRWMCLYYGRY